MGHDGTSWRLRPAILAAVGALAALAVQQLTDRLGPVAEWRVSLAIGIAVAGVALDLALERVRVAWTLLFALVTGSIAGLVAHWNGPAGGNWLFDWPYLSLAIALGIVLPLFQVARDEGGARWPYPAVHEHAWTNVLLWLAAWAFTGVVFLLAWLLAALFGLIGLRFLRELLVEGWFVAMLAGAAFGGALGLLRERERVVRLLRNVTMAVLGVLAPVMAVGLVVFLAALPFTGLGVLWETRAATATLLSAAAGALLLANAVIGDGPGDESRNPAVRWAAMALAASVLPFCVIAAVATGLRLDQYGATPERLWALVFVAIGCAYGLAYLVALVRGRQGWACPARDGNLRLAFGVAGVALLLATPVVSFNSIATDAQVARLKGGQVTPDQFDWAALQYDFGEPGRVAVAELARSADARIAAQAKNALASANRYDVAARTRAATAVEKLTARLRVLPRPVTVPASLIDLMASSNSCGEEYREARCTLFYTPGATEAFSVDEACLIPPPPPPAGFPATPPVNRCSLNRFYAERDEWVPQILGGTGDTADAAGERQRAAVRAMKIEVRPVQRRQLFVGDTPTGEVFE